MKTTSFKSHRFKLAFFITIVLGLLIIASSLSRIIIPLGIAYVLSLMLKPVQKSFYSVDLKRKGLSILMVLGFGFIFSYPVFEVIQTVSEESHKIEYYLPKLEVYLQNKYQLLVSEVKTKFNYDIKTNPVDSLIEFGQENTKQVFVFLPKIIGSLLEWGLLIPLFLFFILRDERAVRFQFIKIVPNNIMERAYYLYHQFNTKFGDYIFAKAIEAAIIGIIITTGLLLLGYPFAFLLGIVAAITNILPYIGPFLGYAPALIIGLVDQNPNTTLGAMTALYLIANIIDLALVFPVLVSKIVNLHPVVVVVSVIVGSQFAGVVGMIISIPMAAFFKLLFQEIYSDLYRRS